MNKLVPLCDSVLDPCEDSPDPCHQLAQCSFDGKTLTCTCPDYLIGHGLYCTGESCPFLGSFSIVDFNYSFHNPGYDRIAGVTTDTLKLVDAEILRK